MPRLFQRQLLKLEQRLEEECALVEEAVQKAVKAFQMRDPDLADEVIDGDERIDNQEVDIEDECLQILALYQPVAQDLRFVVAALKINNDLERVGDLAQGIAKRARILVKHPEIDVPFDFHSMATSALDMLKCSLDAFSRFDVEAARQIRPMDEKVDEKNREAAEMIARATRDNPDHQHALLQCFAVARSLERLGDLATNIAEDIIYITEGVIVRHVGSNVEHGEPRLHGEGNYFSC